METENQTEAESLATWLEHISGGISAQKTASELRRLSARVQELEAMLSAVGAGGASAQRATQAKDHIAHPLEMVAAPVVLPEPVAAQFRFTDGSHNWRDCSLELAKKYQGLWKIEIRYLNTEQQVRDLLAKATCTKSQTAAQEPSNAPTE